MSLANVTSPTLSEGTMVGPWNPRDYLYQSEIIDAIHQGIGGYFHQWSDEYRLARGLAHNSIDAGLATWERECGRWDSVAPDVANPKADSNAGFSVLTTLRVLRQSLPLLANTAKYGGWNKDDAFAQLFAKHGSLCQEILTHGSRYVTYDEDFWARRLWQPAHGTLLHAAYQRAVDLDDHTRPNGWIDQSWDEIGVDLFQIKVMGHQHSECQEEDEAICSSACEPLSELWAKVDEETKSQASTVLERYLAAENGRQTVESKQYALGRKRADLERRIYGEDGTALQPSEEWLNQLTGSNGQFIDDLISKQCRNMGVMGSLTQ